jgi:hypothetical protein
MPRLASAYGTIVYAALLHLIEAFIVLRGDTADGSIGISSLLRVIPNHQLLGCVLIASALAAIIAVTSVRRFKPVSIILLLSMQQACLFTTAIGAWTAVWFGLYADGTIRSSQFILTDQLPRGMFAFLHMMAILAVTSFCAYLRAAGGSDRIEGRRRRR